MCVKFLNLTASILLKDLPSLWEQNDILILLIDLDSCNLSIDLLNDNEKEELDNLRTSYFRKRYIVSRKVLKFVMDTLLEGQSGSKIGTYKDEYGRVHIQGHEEVHICISYTANIVSLGISKVNLGIDIELKRPFCAGKFSNYLNKQALDTDIIKKGFNILTIFTLKEAYCKYSNKNILSCFNKELDFSNIFSSSYILNDRYILSIITDPKPFAIYINFLQKIEAS